MRQIPSSSRERGEWTSTRPRFPTVWVKPTYKADVGRAVDQNLLPRRGKGLDSRGHAPEHAVFIADMLALQPQGAVAPPLPGEDALIIFLAHRIVAQRREREPLSHRVENGRRDGIGHVRDPHRDRVKALVHPYVPGDHVRGDRVPSAAVENGRKIVWHCSVPPCLLFSHHTTDFPLKTAPADDKLVLI